MKEKVKVACLFSKYLNHFITLFPHLFFLLLPSRILATYFSDCFSLKHTKLDGFPIHCQEVIELTYGMISKPQPPLLPSLIAFYAFVQPQLSLIAALLQRA
jgi:hypothetical protein